LSSETTNSVFFASNWIPPLFRAGSWNPKQPEARIRTVPSAALRLTARSSASDRKGIHILCQGNPKSNEWHRVTAVPPVFATRRAAAGSDQWYPDLPNWRLLARAAPPIEGAAAHELGDVSARRRR
jgi:hypothetical protein